MYPSVNDEEKLYIPRPAAARTATSSPKVDFLWQRHLVDNQLFLTSPLTRSSPGPSDYTSLKHLLADNVEATRTPEGLPASFKFMSPTGQGTTQFLNDSPASVYFTPYMTTPEFINGVSDLASPHLQPEHHDEQDRNSSVDIEEFLVGSSTRGVRIKRPVYEVSEGRGDYAPGVSVKRRLTASTTHSPVNLKVNLENHTAPTRIVLDPIPPSTHRRYLPGGIIDHSTRAPPYATKPESTEPISLNNLKEDNNSSGIDASLTDRSSRIPPGMAALHL
ncbi:hypothetical protein FRC12_003495 [Ceratobasidium sp. 428]|nr:hypothetical protein FRC12_003495 [Ceratobasidium sp. 428]